MNLFGWVGDFEWDKGNQDKNFAKHGVTNEECEEVFFDPHKKLFKAQRHEAGAERYILIGATQLGRLLFVVFMIRKDKIRVISARDLNRKEGRLYEESA